MSDDPSTVARLAGATLVFAGALSLGPALWLASLAGTDAAWWWLLSYLVGAVGEATALARGSVLGPVGAIGFPLGVAVLLAVAGLQVVGGWRTYVRGPSRLSAGAAVAGVVNPLSLPVSVLALVLVVSAHRRRSTPDEAASGVANN